MNLVRTIVVPLVSSVLLLGGPAAHAAAPGVAGAGPGAAPGAEAAAPTRTFLVHNVAGRLENRGRVDPVAGETVRMVRKRQPYAAALQEVCGRQAFAMDRRLAAYRVLFYPTGVRCEGDQGFGNAILIRNGPVTRRQDPLPGRGSRTVGCVSRTSPRIAVCTTHLTADRSRGAERLRQAEKVARVATGLTRRGFATFFGGDLNDQPATRTTNPLYRPGYGGGARGIFTESEGCCGRDGDPTLGTVKFDYGFASHQWRVRRGYTSPSASSDHERLWTVLRRK